jgi:antitoxin CcdA
MRIYNAHMSRAARQAKVPTNLSVPGDLVSRAKELNLNLSEVLEVALRHAIRDAERAAWLASNQAAIESYNARVDERGVFSDDWRKF